LTYKQQQVDINSEFELFISQQRSDKTKETYRHFIDKFLAHLADHQLDFRTLTVKDVDHWRVDLYASYSTNTIHTNIRTLGSFYRFLSIRHPEVFTVNLFHSAKLPKIERKVCDIVTDQDVNTALDHLADIDRPDVIALVSLLNNYGFRVGIFEKMHLQDNGRFTSVSKGQPIKGRFTKFETSQIRLHKLIGRKLTPLQSALKRATYSLHKRGKITSAFSAHDLRHKHILDTMTKHSEGAAEFLKQSRRFHRNPRTTMSYIEDFLD